MPMGPYPTQSQQLFYKSPLTYFKVLVEKIPLYFVTTPQEFFV